MVYGYEVRMGAKWREGGREMMTEKLLASFDLSVCLPCVGEGEMRLVSLFKCDTHTLIHTRGCHNDGLERIGRGK